MLESLREQLYQLHLELPKNNLVAWTGGNVSAGTWIADMWSSNPQGSATNYSGRSIWLLST
jgi:ribulose-5-phosphate 4-epimerase/fuculose-1-phosphate aldolase